MNKTKRRVNRSNQRQSLRHKQRGGVAVLKTKKHDTGMFTGLYDGKRLIGNKGTWVYKTGEIYKGEINDDLSPHGQGKYIWPDGHTYIGSYKNGERDGKGKLTYPDGTVYTGDFKEDTRHGTGIIEFANGDSYQGGFENDVAHGIGKGIHNDGGQIYEGEMNMGMKHGIGKITKLVDPNDKNSGLLIYEGEFKYDKANGEGKLTYPDGTVYVGKILELENGVLIGKSDTPMPNAELIPPELFHLLPKNHMFTEDYKRDFVALASASLGMSNKQANELYDEIKANILKSAKKAAIQSRVDMARIMSAKAKPASK